jgi:hypothetical protein
MLDLVLIALGVYALIGIIIGVPLLLLGLNRIDPLIRSSSISVRLLLLPGIITLWPIMLTKWVMTRRIIA